MLSEIVEAWAVALFFAVLALWISKAASVAAVVFAVVFVVVLCLFLLGEIK